ncbi:MGH1-like glycoside hydrolase domain-containing protein [Amycolatopsis jiangsuensis]|uniref:Alpha-L-rhamnosidase six-hairpin glycosidase domain-containing protein n=1 Tax=Amycolatopsis jiangsuensis TaxID=1181879 RepID=A0A840IQQ8_9PSEU|nr:glycosyl hydrolase family 65 protein [Amycolatopsis jiangsuensis]MBB4684163.1 hypothetical protein [Amycolatopsis jiangsuensis]
MYALPTLEFANPQRQRLFGDQYESALTNVVGINTVYADRPTYDHADLLSYPPGTFVRAGGGYPEPQRWTRDAAVNAWNAGSLLGPPVGRNTLLSVVERAGGALVVQQDNQWWDQVVWILGAQYHWQVTGDAEFLALAYEIGTATVAERKSRNFSARHGLFTGPSFMNDGIAGYPQPPWQAGTASSFVLDYPLTHELMCLSTNCLYYGAYLALADLAEALGKDGRGHRADAARLRTSINRSLWRPDAGTYGYFLHGDGSLDPSQEGAGLAFAMLFGVAGAEQIGKLLEAVHWEPHGIVNSWPHFPRFSDAKPGRHNVVVWPMVHSFFGEAVARAGRPDLFGRALTNVADLVAATDGGFYEIYDAKTGAVQGGWQTGGSGEQEQFTSQPDQAWSATGYLRMIFGGLFGLTFSGDGLAFAPCLPSGWGPVTLRGLRYRDATLDLTLHGAGSRVTACTVDGRPSRPAVPTNLTGRHEVRLVLTEA